MLVISGHYVIHKFSFLLSKLDQTEVRINHFLNILSNCGVKCGVTYCMKKP